MIPDHIERDMLIEAPIDYVWRALTDPEQLMEWFPNEATLDLRPGGKGKYVWFDRAAVAEKQGTAAWLQVESVDEPTLFSFRWGHPEGELATPHNSLLVAFTLSEESEALTRLRLVESGVRGLQWSDDQKTEYIADHELGWDKHLADLQTYLKASHV